MWKESQEQMFENQVIDVGELGNTHNRDNSRVECLFRKGRVGISRDRVEKVKFG